MIREHDYLLRLEQAFIDVGLPFKVSPVERIQIMPNFSDFSPSENENNYMWVMEIRSQCTEDEIDYLSNGSMMIDKIIEEPIIDLDSHKRIHDMFADEQAAFDFGKTIKYPSKNRFLLKVNIALEEAEVDRFLTRFKADTEPLRRKRFSDQFDEQVEDHLGEDKYNGDNGYK